MWFHEPESHPTDLSRPVPLNRRAALAESRLEGDIVRAVRGTTLGALLGYAVVAWTAEAHAQAPEARGAGAESAAPSAENAARAQQLFDDGVADMLAGSFDRGCALLNQSHRIDPKAGTLFTLAECYARAGKTASAVRHYALYLTLYELMTPEQIRAHRERAAVARAERNKLLREVPRLEVYWSGRAPAGAQVTLDGAPLDNARIGRALSVDPGQHLIEFSDGTGGMSRREVRLEGNQSLRVVLPAPRVSGRRAGSGARSANVEEEPTSSRRTWAYIVGGIGVTGVLVGSVTGILVLAKKSDVDEFCRDVSGDRAECEAEGIAASNSAKKLGAVSTIAFATGAVGLAAGITLLLTEPASNSSGTRPSGWRVRVAGAPSRAQFSLTTSF